MATIVSIVAAGIIVVALLVVFLLWRKKSVDCPACGENVKILRHGLRHKAKCYCDDSRKRAEATARGDGEEMAQMALEGSEVCTCQLVY